MVINKYLSMNRQVVSMKKGEYAVEMALGATFSAIKNSLLWNDYGIDNTPLDFMNIPGDMDGSNYRDMIVLI